MAELAWVQGNGKDALAHYEESFVLYQELGHTLLTVISLLRLGNLARWQGEYPRAAALVEQGLALARESNHRRMGGYICAALGDTARDSGDTLGALAMYQEGLDLLQEVGDKNGLLWVLIGLGRIALHQGDHQHALAILQESFALAREVSQKHTAGIALAAAADVMCAVANYAGALAFYRESLTVLARPGRGPELAQCLEGMARVARGLGQHMRAAYLYGTADAMRRSRGMPLPIADGPAYAREISSLRAALGDGVLTAAWKAGQAMGLEQAIVYALESAPITDDVSDAVARLE
jgi:tetratricopeptide (TPR) repeat protein